MYIMKNKAEQLLNEESSAVVGHIHSSPFEFDQSQFIPQVIQFYYSLMSVPGIFFLQSVL